MLTRSRRERVGAADRAPHAASQPALENSALSGYAELVCWQLEVRNVSFEKLASFLMIDLPSHDGDLQERQKASIVASRAPGVASCAGRDHHTVSTASAKQRGA